MENIKDSLKASPKYSIFLWTPIQKLFLLKTKFSFYLFLIKYLSFGKLAKENKQNEEQQSIDPSQQMEKESDLASEIPMKMENQEDTFILFETQITQNNQSTEKREMNENQTLVLPMVEELNMYIDKCNRMLKLLMIQIFPKNLLDGDTNFQSNLYLKFISEHDIALNEFLNSQLIHHWIQYLNHDFSILYEGGLLYYFNQIIRSSLYYDFINNQDDTNSQNNIPSSFPQSLLQWNEDILDSDASEIWFKILELQSFSRNVNSLNYNIWNHFEKLKYFSNYLFDHLLTTTLHVNINEAENNVRFNLYNQQKNSAESNLQEKKIITTSILTTFGKFCHKVLFPSKYISQIEKKDNSDLFQFMGEEIENKWGNIQENETIEQQYTPSDPEMLKDLNSIRNFKNIHQFVVFIESIFQSYYDSLINSSQSSESKSNNINNTTNLNLLNNQDKKLPFIQDELLNQSFKLARQIDQLRDYLFPMINKKVALNRKYLNEMEIMITSLSSLDPNFFIYTMIQTESSL